MTARRIAIWSITAAALVVLVALLWPFAALFIVMVLGPPDDITWDDRRAYVKCEGAIAKPALWPGTSQAACRAMNMCAAEATLSAKQRTALDDAIRKAGCK